MSETYYIGGEYMKGLRAVLLIILLMCSCISASMATKYDYDMNGESDPNFNSKMTNANVLVEYDVGRDAWAVEITVNAEKHDGEILTQKDLFDNNGLMYLDYNRELKSIFLSYSGGGIKWADAEIVGNTVYTPFENLFPDGDGLFEVYLVHEFINHNGGIVHLRTSNIATLDYDAALRIRENGGSDTGTSTGSGVDDGTSSEKSSILEGVVYDRKSLEYIEDAVVTINGVSDTTNYNGEFRINDVQPGMVSISVVKSGYYHLNDQIEIFPDKHYRGVEIQLDINPDAVGSEWDEEDEGYKEEKNKATSGSGAFFVFGGAIAGAGLLFFRNGLRKKNKNYRKEKDSSYKKNKKIEKLIKQKKPDYENKYVKEIEDEEKRLEKERQDQLSKMNRKHTDSFGTSVGKGIKNLLTNVKKVSSKVKKFTDKIQGHIDKIKDINLASYKGMKLKVGLLLDLAGNPLKKFEKLKAAIDAFDKKNLSQVVKDELNKLTNVAKQLGKKISALKQFNQFKKQSKIYKKAVNLNKKVNVVKAIKKNPEILIDGNYKDIRKSTPTIDTQLTKEANRLDKMTKDMINNQTNTFVKDVKKQL